MSISDDAPIGAIAFSKRPTLTILNPNCSILAAMRSPRAIGLNCNEVFKALVTEGLAAARLETMPCSFSRSTIF